MAGHSHLRLPAEEPADFAAKTSSFAKAAVGAGVVGLAIALLMGFLAKDEFRRFYFAYLTAFGFFLAIALGALFFVLIHHVSRAGWSVNVRRVAENIAALLPVLGVLSAPIFISVLIQRGDLYRWALPESAKAVEAKHELPHNAGRPAAAEGADHKPATDVPDSPHEGHEAADHEADPGPGHRTLDPLTLQKRAWLNPMFFCVRLLAYFVIWSAIALYYRRQSTLQDADGDYRHTSAMQKYSGVALVFFGLTLTMAAFDLFMSLDPHWYSTMFGVYYFAGAAVTFFATMIVILASLQRLGYLKEAVNTEHYHDLGKYLFAFTFFWGYIAFSQYMLLWYASLPEEVTWPARRGASSASYAPGNGNEWRWWAVTVLFGCLLIPFAGLLSRHVKRNKPALLFWAVWLLVFHFVNTIWIVLPEMRLGLRWAPILTSLAALLGIGGVLAAVWVRSAAKYKLRPVNDPRMAESAAFVNI